VGCISGTGTILGREPALVAGAVDAIINVLVAFHVIMLSGDQIAQVNVVMAAIFVLIVLQVVTPTRSPKLPIGTRERMPAGGPAVVSGASPSRVKAVSLSGA
jgi:hypothetical protein